MNGISDCAILHNGVQMPWLGFGVFQIPEGEAVIRSVLSALETGYRSIDTAAAYGNERSVGKALNDSGVPREEIFLTTKVWNADQGYDSTLRAFDSSLKKLDTDYIDLYLIHWPGRDRFVDTWKALEKLYQDKQTRAIGVSNFRPVHLETLMKQTQVVPMVNQVEFHPHLVQPELLSFCEQHKIQMEAWSPLIRGEIVSVPEVVDIADKHGQSPAQVVLRWDLQHRVVTIPRSVRAERIRENSRIFDFQLSEQEMAAIDALDQGRRIGPDPDSFF